MDQKVMQVPINEFKRGLLQGRQQIGVWCTIPGSGHAEALASCGFDWMLIEMEHSVVDLATVQSMLQAAAPYDTHMVVRPGWNDPIEIKRLLDAGVQSFLVPFVQSAAEAARAVAAVLYPPDGMRGISTMTRATRFGLVNDYVKSANREICLIVQVETVTAVEQIEEIARVPGVDGVFIGPSNLSASMGFPGEPDRPEVQAMALDAIARVRAVGKAAGILTLNDGFLERAIDAGSIVTAVEVDQSLLVRHARARAADWKGLARR